MSEQYDFLSADWSAQARLLYDEYADKLPEPPVQTRVNFVVTDVPHGDTPELNAYIDTSKGVLAIEEGHLEDVELTVTTDYETARSVFVFQDQQALMESFLAGKILVEGDPSQLIAMQSNQIDPDPIVLEFNEAVQAITASA